MISIKRHKIYPKRKMTLLTTFAFIICLQLSSRRQFVSGDEEVASDMSIIPIEVDSNFKNFKQIGNKIIPDVSSIMKLNEPHLDNLKQFLSAGELAALEYDGYKSRRDIPFTIIVPKVDIKSIEKPRLKDFFLEHLIPGKVFDEFNTDDLYGNSNGHKITFQRSDLKWTLNGLKVLQKLKFNENLGTIFVDGFLADRKTAFSKRNIQEHNRYNEPQRLEMKNSTTKNEPTSTKESKSSPLMTFLSNMKSGTKVFQHFLSKSNLTQVMDDGHYTILIPADSAFQRWHPIDWGFYPFSVQEFTENVLRNHFLQSQTPLRMADVKNSNKLIFNTLGGESVVFKSNPTPSVNNVSILSDYTLPNGNQVFIISEVLFVSEAVVSKLHQMHKDKETPPLLAFPWFGAQFLSHSFLALERDPRFTQITRYLNNAEIAPYISGANFTFFVPEDEAFEKNGFDAIPDEILASPKGVKMLLNHFVKGRLYDRDLKDNEVFETIGGGVIKIQRKPFNNVTVNMAKITETEVFVYNLGTMFYIDDILYADILREYAVTQSSKIPASTLSTASPFQTTTVSNGISYEASDNGVTFYKTQQPGLASSPPSDVEIVPSEFITEHSGTEGDILINNGRPRNHDSHDEDDELDDDEIITPKALPVRFNFDPPK